MSVIGQDVTVTYQAVNVQTPNVPVNNDQANHTLKLIAGGTESNLTTTISAKSNGTYSVTVPAAQNSDQFMTLTGLSTTPNIVIIQVRWENDVPGINPVSTIPTTGGVAKFKDRILRNLGNGDSEDINSGVTVELTDGDILACLEETVELLNRYRPRRNKAVFNGVSAGQTRYPVSQPGLLEVIDVQFCANQASSTVPDPFDPLINGVLGVNTWDAGGAADYLRYNMALKDAQQIYGTAPDWYFQVDVDSAGVNTPVVYMTIPQGVPYTVGYDYTWALTPDDDPRTGVVQVERTMLDWFYNYGTAMAKIKVGRKRAKFGGIATSDEGSSETDGGELISSGEEMKTALEQDLKNRRSAAPIMVG